MYTNKHFPYQDIECFPHSRNLPLPLLPKSNPYSNFYLIYHRCVLPAFELRSNGIRWFALFSSKFFHLSLSVRSIHVFACGCTQQRFVLFYCNKVFHYINRPQFIYPFCWWRTWWLFLIWSYWVANTAMNVSFGRYALMSPGLCLGVELLDHRVSICLSAIYSFTCLYYFSPIRL